MEDEYLKISVLHFILLGVYAFCSAVYAYFHFGAKIKNSGPILILSLVTLIKLSFLYPICVGIFETATSTQFFPFMGFLWLLGFYFYFKLVAKILGMSGRYFSIYTKILKICIILMGAITFAFKLSIVRKIFFTLKDPAKVDGFMYFPPDSMPTFYGYITIFILGTIIGLGHFGLMVKSNRGELKNKNAFIRFQAILGFTISIYDVMTLLGFVDFVTLTVFIYIPLIVHLLSRVFSAPYIDIYDTRDRLKSELNRSDGDYLELRRKLTYKSIESMICNIKEFLEEKYRGRFHQATVEVDKRFFILGGKTELTVLLYNLMEKSFEYASGRVDHSGVIHVLLRNDHVPKMEVTSMGPDAPLCEKDFELERDLAAKLDARLILKKRKEFMSYTVEFEG